jgi:hypothetical protein
VIGMALLIGAAKVVVDFREAGKRQPRVHNPWDEDPSSGGPGWHTP